MIKRSRCYEEAFGYISLHQGVDKLISEGGGANFEKKNISCKHTCSKKIIMHTNTAAKKENNQTRLVSPKCILLGG